MNFSLRGFAEAFGFALAALWFYLRWLPNAFYKVDGVDIARLYQEGSSHPWHPGYLPALRGFHSLVETLGYELDLLTLGCVFSAVGTAIGVGFARAGMGRLGMASGSARLATLLFATCPIVVTFGRVVEFHGPMLAPYGLCFWWLAEQVRRPSIVGMVVLGALCHLPFLIHGQQLLLPCWLLALFVMKRGISRRSIGLAAIAGGVHALLFGLLPLLLPGFYGFWADLAAGAAAEGSIGRPQSLDYTPRVLWEEWLLAWPVWSVVAFAAGMRVRQRRECTAFVIGFAPYLFVCVRQLVFEPEFGAYMLPMVLPAAMLIGQWLSRHWLVWLLCCQPILFGIAPGLAALPGDGAIRHLCTQRRHHDDFQVVVEEVADGASPFVLVGSHRELGDAFARLSPDQFLWVRQNAVLPRDKLEPQQLVIVEMYLKQLHAQGRCVLLTESALGSLEDPGAAMLAEKATLEVPANDQLSGPLFAAHLREKFDLQAMPEVTMREGPIGPRLWRLVPK
ncbi:MAG: hypothetical protein NXI31_00975 [bacterium]|nr:hypothetical protein [bacterium]